MAEHLDLEEIEKACEAATSGPWAFKIKGKGLMDTDCGRIVGPNPVANEVCSFGDSTQYYPSSGSAPEDQDMRFILGAREWVPALVARCRELEADRNELHRELRQAETLAAGMGSSALQLIREEREACAKLAEDYEPPDLDSSIQEGIASAIRARGSK